MARYKIDDVDWDKLACVGGVASHFPKALRLLFSSYPKNRNLAYWKLDNYAICQGHYFEAAPYATDIIIGFLEEGRGPKIEAFYFLEEMGYGSCSEEDRSDYLGYDTSLPEACAHSLLQGIDLFISELNNEDLRIQSYATNIVQSCLGFSRQYLDEEFSTDRVQEINRCIFQSAHISVSDERSSLLLALEEHDEEQVPFLDPGGKRIYKPSMPSRMEELLLAMGSFSSQEAIEKFYETHLALAESKLILEAE